MITLNYFAEISFKPKVKRELITTRGKPLFYGGETMAKWTFFSWFNRTFEYRFVDVRGRLSLIVKGSQRGAGTYAVIHI